MKTRATERGAALLVVVVAVAILTALAAEVAYSSRVRLQLAADARDELRATWLARSGIETARLVLALQQQVDASAGATAAAVAAAGAGGAAAGALSLNIRIWALVPVSSGLVTGLLGGGPAPERPANAPGAPAEGAPPLARFGDFDGAFEANIEDESSKVNAQLDGTSTGGRLGPQLQALFQLICDPRWDPLFDREDSHGQRVTRPDLLVNLRDFIDDRSNTAALKATFPGTACLMELPSNPFEDGFGDENAPYDRGPSEERYKTKNAPFDSLDELYLVAGVSDAFMSAFGDRLTVYLPREAPQTVPRDPDGLVALAKAIASPPGQAILYTDEFKVRLYKAVTEKTLGGMLGMSGQTFGEILTSLGEQIPTDATAPGGGNKSYVTDRSYVYRIHSTGSAGQVNRTLDAVVTFDPKNQTTGAPPPGKNPGRLLHWRED
jgi:general secretion pathway protein K